MNSEVLEQLKTPQVADGVNLGKVPRRLACSGGKLLSAREQS